MAVAFERNHLWLEPVEHRGPIARPRRVHHESHPYRSPHRTVAAIAVVLLHVLMLAGFMAVQFTPRIVPREPVVETVLVPRATTAPEPDAPPTIAPDWQPRIAVVPVAPIAVDAGPSAITVAMTPAPVQPSMGADTSAAPTPKIDAQSVGYLVAPAPRYPDASRRLREQGDVLLRVLIDTNGRPVRLEVLESSGFARLDAAALDAVRAALFRPYLIEGRARAAFVRVPIGFTLRRG